MEKIMKSDHATRAFAALIDAADGLERARMAAAHMETKPDLQEDIRALQAELRRMTEQPRVVAIEARGKRVSITWPGRMSRVWVRRVAGLLGAS